MLWFKHFGLPDVTGVVGVEMDTFGQSSQSARKALLTILSSPVDKYITLVCLECSQTGHSDKNCEKPITDCYNHQHLMTQLIEQLSVSVLPFHKVQFLV